MKQLYIDTPQALHDLCEQLHDIDVIALDTEFLREKTYYARFCLLQLASKDLLACIDPLALDDLSPLLDIIYDPRVTKVMHSARQDLEIFHDYAGELPKNIFDTQIAAPLLGCADQMGYANLVNQLLDITLDKSHTRTDWSKRPLDSGQLKYAYDDVRYLIEIYHQQYSALEEKNRLRWLEEDFSSLSDKKLYVKDEQDLWRRVRGASSLKRGQLAVLQGLAIWREQQACSKNRPRRWVVRDTVLLDLARRMPANIAELKKIPGWDFNLDRHVKDILQVIEQKRDTPHNECPSLIIYGRLTPAQESLVEIIMAMVRQCARENAIATTVLTSRKEIDKLVLGKDDCQFTQGWRGELLGKNLLGFIRSQNCLSVKRGLLEIHPKQESESAIIE